jgi:hypothetical protein
MLMGEMAYNFLACEWNATSGQHFPGFFVHCPLPVVIYDAADPLSPFYNAPSPNVTYVLVSMLRYIPGSPLMSPQE